MKVLYFAFACAFLVGCAASGRPATDDAGIGSGGTSGGDDLSVAGSVVDMTQPLPFGDPCTDPSQCQSKICVFTGTGGVCSVDCPSIGCPTGYGCYGVVGVIDPGVATNVCVPENNLLCTPCSKSSECGSSTGHDLCLPYPTGSFCGRDCSTISCPPTYSCQDVTVGDAGTFKQCVPNNNACDCTPQKMGVVTACTITTPTGTSCAGSRTCNGAQGWSSCSAPSTTDTPDDSFTDSNCDGIDGDVSQAIFVDGLFGNDSNPGTMQMPVRSIPQGVTLAQSNGKSQVLVSKGTYAPLTLVSGAKIYGGYDAANHWQRSANNITTISGGNPAVDGANLNAETRLEQFNIVASDASGGPGQSSYGVRIVSSAGPVYIRSSTIKAGNGTDGINGSSGGGGADGQVGGSGPNGCENCSQSIGGGGGGASSCNAGGTGGSGTGGTGSAPGGASGSGPLSGPGGGGGCGCDKSATLCATTCSCGGRCSPISGGSGGSGQNGGNGLPAAPFGGVSGNVYTPANGGDGSNGTDGSGGGGGGGGGGSNGPCFCNEYTGGGGGGGGGAGCHGTRGTAGTGGGGSFAVFLVGSNVTVDKCALASGNGGNGGNGGSGGLGGNGGPGGVGGLPDTDGEQGANGGNGGNGGAAGSGAGGSGGPSYGLYSKSGNVTLSNNSYQPGAGGAAGNGGSNGAVGPAASGQPGPSNSYRQD